MRPISSFFTSATTILSKRIVPASTTATAIVSTAILQSQIRCFYSSHKKISSSSSSSTSTNTISSSQQQQQQQQKALSSSSSGSVVPRFFDENNNKKKANHDNNTISGRKDQKTISSSNTNNNKKKEAAVVADFSAEALFFETESLIDSALLIEHVICPRGFFLTDLGVSTEQHRIRSPAVTTTTTATTTTQPTQKVPSEFGPVIVSRCELVIDPLQNDKSIIFTGLAASAEKAREKAVFRAALASIILKPQVREDQQEEQEARRSAEEKNPFFDDHLENNTRGGGDDVEMNNKNILRVLLTFPRPPFSKIAEPFIYIAWNDILSQVLEQAKLQHKEKGVEKVLSSLNLRLQKDYSSPEKNWTCTFSCLDPSSSSLSSSSKEKKEKLISVSATSPNCLDAVLSLTRRAHRKFFLVPGRSRLSRWQKRSIDRLAGNNDPRSALLGLYRFLFGNSSIELVANEQPLLLNNNNNNNLNSIPNQYYGFAFLLDGMNAETRLQFEKMDDKPFDLTGRGAVSKLGNRILLLGAFSSSKKRGAVTTCRLFAIKHHLLGGASVEPGIGGALVLPKKEGGEEKIDEDERNFRYALFFKTPLISQNIAAALGEKENEFCKKLIRGTEERGSKFLLNTASGTTPSDREMRELICEAYDAESSPSRSSASSSSSLSSALPINNNSKSNNVSASSSSSSSSSSSAETPLVNDPWSFEQQKEGPNTSSSSSSTSSLSKFSGRDYIEETPTTTTLLPFYRKSIQEALSCENEKRFKMIREHVVPLRSKEEEEDERKKSKGERKEDIFFSGSQITKTSSGFRCVIYQQLVVNSAEIKSEEQEQEEDESKSKKKKSSKKDKKEVKRSSSSSKTNKQLRESEEKNKKKSKKKTKSGGGNENEVEREETEKMEEIIVAEGIHASSEILAIYKAYETAYENVVVLKNKENEKNKEEKKNEEKEEDKPALPPRFTSSSSSHSNNNNNNSLIDAKEIAASLLHYKYGMQLQTQVQTSTATVEDDGSDDFLINLPSISSASSSSSSSGEKTTTKKTVVTAVVVSPHSNKRYFLTRHSSSVSTQEAMRSCLADIFSQHFSEFRIVLPETGERLISFADFSPKNKYALRIIRDYLQEEQQNKSNQIVVALQSHRSWHQPDQVDYFSCRLLSTNSSSSSPSSSALVSEHESVVEALKSCLLTSFHSSSSSSTTEETAAEASSSSRKEKILNEFESLVDKARSEPFLQPVHWKNILVATQRVLLKTVGLSLVVSSENLVLNQLNRTIWFIKIYLNSKAGKSMNPDATHVIPQIQETPAFRERIANNGNSSSSSGSGGEAFIRAVQFSPATTASNSDSNSFSSNSSTSPIRPEDLIFTGCVARDFSKKIAETKAAYRFLQANFPELAPVALEMFPRELENLPSAKQEMEMLRGELSSKLEEKKESQMRKQEEMKSFGSAKNRSLTGKLAFDKNSSSNNNKRNRKHQEQLTKQQQEASILTKSEQNYRLRQFRRGSSLERMERGLTQAAKATREEGFAFSIESQQQKQQQQQVQTSSPASNSSSSSSSPLASGNAVSNPLRDLLRLALKEERNMELRVREQKVGHGFLVYVYGIPIAQEEEGEEEDEDGSGSSSPSLILSGEVELGSEVEATSPHKALAMVCYRVLQEEFPERLVEEVAKNENLLDSVLS